LFGLLLVLHCIYGDARFLAVTSVVYRSCGLGRSRPRLFGACIFVDIYKHLVHCSMAKSSPIIPPKARPREARGCIGGLPARALDERHHVVPVVLAVLAAGSMTGQRRF
jgi:hypothetical protein